MIKHVCEEIPKETNIRSEIWNSYTKETKMKRVKEEGWMEEQRDE